MPLHNQNVFLVSSFLTVVVAAELKKEELIPGLLLPRPQPANPYSSTHDSLCQKPVVTSGYKGLQNVSCTEVHASNIGTTADDGMSVLPPLPTIDTQCTFNGVSEPDCSIASPQDCVDTTTADNCLDHAQSLVKIQRSKSRQRALELRNSAKATKSHSCNENDAIVFASQDIGFRLELLDLVILPTKMSLPFRFINLFLAFAFLDP